MRRDLDEDEITNEECIEEFYDHLEKERDAIPLVELRSFLATLLRDEGKVEVRRRSIMRKIRGDTRFAFKGTTRDRHVYLDKNTNQTAANLDGADTLVRAFVKHTSKTGLNEFSEQELHPSYESSAAVFDWNAASQVLIGSGVVTQSGDRLEWTHKGFFGYEPLSKRSSALSLPHRTWDTVHEIQAMFDHANFYPPHQEDSKAQSPILHLALSKGMPFNKSEIVEIALEHLRSQLYHRVR